MELDVRAAIHEFQIFEYASELDNAVMIVHGENAHSRYFGEDTFKLLRGDNKELLIVADASHCDLYDNLEKIPMNQIATFSIPTCLKKTERLTNSV